MIPRHFASPRFAVALLLCCTLAPAARAAADDWPQWRGPARTGHVPAGVPVPDALPAKPAVVWHTPIGFGLASPVVAGGKVFYLDNQAEKETVHAADAASGEPLWSAELDDTFKDTQSASGPRCTPLVDGGRVYAQSCRGTLKCLNASDGKVVWATNYTKDFGGTFVGEKGKAEGATRHGNNGSPVVNGDHLIAQVGGGKGACLVCFDKATGMVVWKSQDDTPAYAAPFVTTLLGKRQVIAFTVEAVIGVDVAGGALLWRTPIKTALGRHVTTPTVVDDTVCVASHQAGLVGIKVSKDGDGFKADRAWTATDSAINFSSPVAVGHYLYGPGPAKNLVCVDVRTGKQAWSKDGYFSGAAGKTHAGLLVMGKNVLMLTDTGELVMFAADPAECREVGRAQVCGANWCIPAYAGGRLYFRDAHELYCVQLMK